MCLCWHFGVKYLSVCRFRDMLRQIYGNCGLAVSPGKPRVPYCEERPGAAHSRRDQMCVCGFHAHPPTRHGREHWSYHGSGRFGDTMPWRTRVARGARDWDASAIPPGEVLDKHNGFYCVAVCFSAVVIIFFRDSPLREDVRVQTWMDFGTSRAHKMCLSSSGSSHSAQRHTYAGHSASREHSSSCSGDQPEYGCDRATRVSPRPPGHDPAEAPLRLSAAVAAWLGHVPHGQWALLDTDMPLLIDRSACLVEPVTDGASCSSHACAVPAGSTTNAASVAAHETHREALLSKVLCSSELLTLSCSCRLDVTELTELTALMPSTCASSCCLTATLRPPLQRTLSLPWTTSSLGLLHPASHGSDSS